MPIVQMQTIMMRKIVQNVPKIGRLIIRRCRLSVLHMKRLIVFFKRVDYNSEYGFQIGYSVDMS